VTGDFPLTEAVEFMDAWRCLKAEWDDARSWDRLSLEYDGMTYAAIARNDGEQRMKVGVGDTPTEALDNLRMQL
jgi:hypothetical protein